MKIRRGSFSTSFRLGPSSAKIRIDEDAVESQVPLLVGGKTEPSYTPGSGSTPQEIEVNAAWGWEPFRRSSDDGWGNSLAGDLSDARISDMQIPARFVTPYFCDADSTEYVDVIVHPYPGTDENDIDNTFVVYMYLNGGSPVQAVERTIETGYLAGTTVYSCRVPAKEDLRFDVNEIRAVVFPRLGKPSILQAALTTTSEPETSLPMPYEVDGEDPDDPSFNANRVSNTWKLGNRGVLLVKYDDVTLQLGETIRSKIETAGHSRLRVDCSAFNEASLDGASAGTLENILYRRRNISANLTSDPYIVMPKAENGFFKFYGDYDPDEGGILLGALGLYADSCVFVVDPSLSNPAENYYARSRNDYRAPIFQWVNCEVKTRENTSYDGPVTETTLGDGILADGFGEMLRAYDLGKTHRSFVAYLQDNSGLSQASLSFGCTWKYVAFITNEAVGCIGMSPAPSNSDAMGLPALVVNTTLYGVNKSGYPWGSVGANQVTYDYDWQKFGTSDYSALPNSGNLSPTISDVFDGIAAMDTNADGSADDLSQALNLGVWPDFLLYAGTNSAEFNAMYYSSELEQYTDHFGLSYSSWDKWGQGGSYTNSFDIHMDAWHIYSIHVGNVIGNRYSTFASDAQQGLYMTNCRVETVGVWDCKLSLNTTATIEVSIGAETRTWEQGLDYNIGGNTSQFWGPGIRCVDSSGTYTAKDFRGFIKGNKDPNSYGGDVVRGFSYFGSSSFTDAPSEMLSVCGGLTDDGSSRVIQGAAATGATQIDKDKSSTTDKWWNVNLSR